MITGDLGAIFPKRPASEEGRLQDLMKLVREHSPVGAAVLEEAGDCKLFFNEMYGAAGAYYRGLNAIALNPHCSDAQLFSTLVHEARHASQRYADPKNPDMQTQIQLNRAKEADAMAFECSSAFEMQYNYPKAWHLFKKEHPQIAVAYAREIKQSGDRNFAIGEAFKAWHDDIGYVSEYDCDVIKYLSFQSKRAGKKFLTGNMQPQEISGLFCTHHGKGYLNDPDFLSSERALGISESVLAQSKLLARKKEMLYGNFDASVYDLVPRPSDGKDLTFQSKNYFVAKIRNNGR